MEVNGERVGTIKAEDWKARGYHVVDVAGEELARIDKQKLDLSFFIMKDSYQVIIPRELDEPLRSLVVASALALDSAIYHECAPALTLHR